MRLRAWFFAAIIIAIISVSFTSADENVVHKNAANDAQATPPAQQTETQQPAAPQRAYTLWEFQLDVKAFQHEPAGKSLDEFNSTLYFNALMPHDSSEVQKWSGYGTMTAELISRAPSSDQAPHRPLPQFHLQATTYWDQIGKALQINLAPKDAVTYSLKSGPVLGTTSILQHILPAATGPKLVGNLQMFAIPTDTAAGATFVCSFDTMGKHVCWYEGSATLKVIGKREGVFPPQEVAKPTAAEATANPKRSTRLRSTH